MATISQTEKPIDENKRTAIIYSVNDVGYYLVEIRHLGNYKFIEKNGELEKYLNMDEAMQAARKYQVEQAFLALDKTYQEVEADTDDANIQKRNFVNRYDFMPVDLSKN